MTPTAHRDHHWWDRPPEQYTAQTLIPRLHILGAELSEGFFANGVILVEGRSDKAALTATARMMGVSGYSSVAIRCDEGAYGIRADQRARIMRARLD